MSNMNDHAQELANALKESEEFQKLKEAYEQVLSDEDSKELFGKFRDAQRNLQEKQMQGEDISEDEVKSANEIVAEVQQNNLITHLLETEQQLDTMISELSRIITQPLEQLYTQTM